MDPVFQRLGDVTIQRLEKPKDKVGLQGNGDIMEKESKEERIEQNVIIVFFNFNMLVMFLY